MKANKKKVFRLPADKDERTRWLSVFPETILPIPKILLYAKGIDLCCEKCFSILNEKMCDIMDCLPGMHASILKDLMLGFDVQSAMLEMPSLKIKVTVTPKTATFTTV